jgi:peptidoglycan/LPS O-acetylase OafA/YrhL
MRFRALDGFRGLCALIVALYHFPVRNHFLGPQFFLPNAQMLMDFFFVMSGFLISCAYGDKLKTWRDVGGFARARFARLWPLHAAMLAVFVVIEAAKAAFFPHIGLQPPFTGAKAPLGIVTHLLMLHSLHLHPMLTWNAPSWTVSVEFYTYLLFAALVIFWPKRPILTAAVLATIGAFGVVVIARKVDANYDWGLLRCIYGFFCGVLTRRIWKAAPTVLANRPNLATGLEIFATVGVFAYMAVLGGAPFGYAGPLVFSAFIWLYACERGALTRRVMAYSPLVRLGQISYSIYLVHFPLIVVITLGLRLFEHFSGLRFETLGFSGIDHMSFVYGPSKWVMDGVMAVYLALVIAVASQTFKYVEEPGRKLFSPTRKPQMQGAEAAVSSSSLPAVAGLSTAA